MNRMIWFWVLGIALVGCRRLPQGGQVDRYDFAHPDQVWELPAELNEVSGNAFMAENGHLMLVQDEQLGLYEFDPAVGKVVGTRLYGRSADIEGVARRNGTWYLLESNGVLWEVNGDSLRPIQTPFGAENNTEGLTYDARRDRFLIALKGEPARPLPNHRAVHSFDLDSGTATPFLDIDLRAISETHVGAMRLADLGPKRAKKNGRPAKSKLPQLFEPSCIAYDSVVGHSYLLSAKSALVAVYDSNSVLSGVHALSPQIFPKAEGICFGEKGALYISSEAKNGIPAHLAVFFPKR